MDQIIEGLARGITKEKLTEFYADPAVQAEFEAWKERRARKKATELLASQPDAHAERATNG